MPYRAPRPQFWWSNPITGDPDFTEAEIEVKPEGDRFRLTLVEVPTRLRDPATPAPAWRCRSAPPLRALWTVLDLPCSRGQRRWIASRRSAGSEPCLLPL